MHRLSLPVLFILAVVLAACTEGNDVDEASDAQASVPDTWTAEVVDDEQVGAFVVSAPDGATRWAPGDDLGELTDATAGTDWAAFWLPLLEEAATDSNIRAIVTDTEELEGEVVSWQVNVTPRGDGSDFDGPDELAAGIADGLTAQGLEVGNVGSVAWNDQTIATVSFRVPQETFGGEPRFVRQWFFPRSEPSALWSLTCDGPDDLASTEEICGTALDGFRPTDEG